MKNINSLIKYSLVVLIPVFIFIAWNIYRYIPHSPMRDLDYKRAILRDSGNITYTIEALRPIMGPDELSEFIKQNDKNSEIYTPNLNNIRNKNFRANLHTHTTDSDGILTAEERMKKAQIYASRFIRNGYMLIAITDHNTVLGAKSVIEALQRGKYIGTKYNKIKVIPGIEIYTEYSKSKIVKFPIQVHVLVWCINPYDKFLNKEFYKKDLNDKWNRTNPDRNFDWVISTMSEYGIVGVAHPARYTTFMKEKKYPYITEMLKRYRDLTDNIPFTEGYYQSYYATTTGPHLGDEYDKYINYINSEAERLGINRTGSTDAHGYSLFAYK